MFKNKIIALSCIIFISIILTGCGETKDTSRTDNKTKDNMATTKTDTLTGTTQTQTDKKDTSMQNNQTAGKEDSISKKENSTTDGNVVKMETTMGTFKIKLYTDKAPITAGNFKKLVNEGFYNGIIFHRVIDNFMIQGGDPTGTGTGGAKETIKDEFGEGLKHSKKGMLSMANRGPNTGTSQFFITLAATPWLDGKHAIFGEITEGMDVIEKIGKTKTGANDKPAIDIKITKATVVDK